MLLAEQSEAVRLAVITGIMLVVKQLLDWGSLCLKVYLDRERAKALKLATEETATKVEVLAKEAALKVEKVASSTVQKVTAHLMEQDKALEHILVENNGAKEALIKKAQEEAFALGVKSVVDKSAKESA